MLKKFSFILAFFIVVFSTQIHSRETLMMTSSENLIKTTHQYLDFVNRIGRGESFPEVKEGALLFAPDCKKTFNGHLFGESAEKLILDLVSVHENYGDWQNTPLEIIPVPEQSTVVLRMLIEGVNAGKNTAIAILRYDSNGLITEINEVFSPIIDAYDFKNQ